MWTLREIENMEDIGREIERYKLGGFAMEARGKNWPREIHNVICWRGKTGENGTAFIVSKDFIGNVMEFRKVSERISYTRLINLCALTEEKKAEEKEDLYERVAVTCEKTKRHDTLIVVEILMKETRKKGDFSEGRRNTYETLQESKQYIS